MATLTEMSTAKGMSNILIKKGLARALPLRSPYFTHEIHVRVYGKAFRLYLKSEAALDCVYNELPLAVFGEREENACVVHWLDNNEVGFTDAQWIGDDSWRDGGFSAGENDGDQPLVSRSDERNYILHKNFIAICERQRFMFVAPYSHGHALMEFLNWAACEAPTGDHSLVFARGCALLDGQGRAHLCLNPALDTSALIAVTAPSRRLLARTRMVLKIEHGELFVHADLRENGGRGGWVRVIGMFWLQPGLTTATRSVLPSEAITKLLGCARVDNAPADPLLWKSVLGALAGACESVPMRAVEFTDAAGASAAVWKHILRA